jgi:uncharacterized paraquat-inducible protein A
MNFDMDDDMTFVRMTKMALEDPGIDLMRYLCWILSEVKSIPDHTYMVKRVEAPVTMSSCHPSKKHYGRGRCQSCYYKDYYRRKIALDQTKNNSNSG